MYLLLKIRMIFHGHVSLPESIHYSPPFEAAKNFTFLMAHWRIFKGSTKTPKFLASGLGYDYHLLCRRYLSSQIQSHRLQKDQTSKYQPPNVLANLGILTSKHPPSRVKTCQTRGWFPSDQSRPLLPATTSTFFWG